MKNIKIVLAAVAVTFVLGGYAFASLPSSEERLISFNENLIEEHKQDWADADKEQKIGQEIVDRALEKKKKLQEQADMFRLTIKVLKGENDVPDFTQPQNQNQ